ncbi:MAG: hypothetical protein E4G99_00635 [Anaerolineales bacterium]|nr:MAG: hypothetical protein E4G99_00635 [Anaerolineales bacterium]
MDRTVPQTGSEEIELYIRSYYSLLRSTTDVRIQSLEEVHANMGSSLHSMARSALPDFSALIYSSMRLPQQIIDIQRVVLGQSQAGFARGGFGDIENWEPAPSVARRRRSFFDGEATLACYIASRSDIDDMVPILTALQIEWNKLHRLLSGEQVRIFMQAPPDTEEGLAVLAAGMGVQLDELRRLRTVWGDTFWPRLKAITEKPKRFVIRLLAGSLNDYRKATQIWWSYVEQALPSIIDRPVYFVSSNAHSIVNLVSGFALRHEDELLEYIQRPECVDLLNEWQDIQNRQVPSSRENFLYYVLKKYVRTEIGQHARKARAEDERNAGAIRIPSEHAFDVEVQLFELNRIRADWVDPRLSVDDAAALSRSDAVIVNIDYPLGMAAYIILAHMATRVGDLRGVYINGKAATLNGVIGDVMIPSVIHDEHSQNTFIFQNCFGAGDILEDLVYGTVLDNQKAVSVRGTFLQTPQYMDVFYREGYTDIEMEAGPYLSAVYELFRPKRYPTNEIANLYGLPFDLGILHYASDKPVGTGINLGDGSLSYFGMDPTYATSVAILRRIFSQELKRLNS